jgi:hypothetical protein
MTGSSHSSVGVRAVLAVHSATGRDFVATGQPVVGAGLARLARPFQTQYLWLRLRFGWRRRRLGYSIVN